MVTLRSAPRDFPSTSFTQPVAPASAAPPGPQGARNITFALVDAPVTLAETRHECQRRGAEPAGGRGGCTVTRPVGVPHLVPLVCRRHVDLLRVSSAICRFCR